MSRRTLMLTGVVVAVAATIGLASYFLVVGLDQAEKVATVLALFVALAGVALAIPGIVELSRSKRTPTGGESIPPGSSGQRTIIQNGPGSIYSEGASAHIVVNNKDA